MAAATGPEHMGAEEQGQHQVGTRPDSIPSPSPQLLPKTQAVWGLECALGVRCLCRGRCEESQADSRPGLSTWSWLLSSSLCHRTP